MVVQKRLTQWECKQIGGHCYMSDIFPTSVIPFIKNPDKPPRVCKHCGHMEGEEPDDLPLTIRETATTRPHPPNRVR